MNQRDLETAIVAAAKEYCRAHILAVIRRDAARTAPQRHLERLAPRAMAASKREGLALKRLLGLTKRHHKIETGRDDFDRDEL